MKRPARRSRPRGDLHRTGLRHKDHHETARADQPIRRLSGKRDKGEAAFIAGRGADEYRRMIVPYGGEITQDIKPALHVQRRDPFRPWLHACPIKATVKGYRTFNRQSFWQRALRKSYPV